MLYTGMSSKPQGRLEAHNAGRGAKYTRGRGPWRIVYLEFVGPIGDALRRECVIKRMGRAGKLRLIRKGCP